jgi:hypothetical protein
MFKQVAVYCHCGKNLHVGVKKPRLASRNLPSIRARNHPNGFSGPYFPTFPALLRSYQLFWWRIPVPGIVFINNFLLCYGKPQET